MASEPDNVFESLAAFGVVSRGAASDGAQGSTLESDVWDIRNSLTDLSVNERHRRVGPRARPTVYSYMPFPDEEVVIDETYVRTINVRIKAVPVLNPDPDAPAPTVATDLVVLTSKPFMMISLREVGSWQYRVDMRIPTGQSLLMRSVRSVGNSPTVMAGAAPGLFVAVITD